MSLIDDLAQCEKGTEEEFFLYQKIVDFCESEEEIEELKEILNTDVIDHSKGALGIAVKERGVSCVTHLFSLMNMLRRWIIWLVFTWSVMSM